MTDNLEAEARRVAAGLTKDQLRGLDIGNAWGFPAGHNNWPDVEYQASAKDETVICNGEDVDACIRAGLIAVGDRDPDGGEHLIDDDRDCEARWPLSGTPLGLAVKRVLEEGA